MPTKSQRQRAEMAQKAYGTVMDMGRVLRAARIASGLRVEYISQCMNTTAKEWIYYEQNREPIPGHILIKLMIFGMEFWSRNKECFDGTVTLPVPSPLHGAAATPPAKGN